MKNALFIFLALLIGAMIWKYVEYKKLESGIRSMQFDRTVSYFYVKNLRFPRSEAEFKSYISTLPDEEYLKDFSEYSLHFRFDSIQNVAIVYMDGLDQDDDDLRYTYSLDRLGFFKSLFKDGDIIVQRFSIPECFQELRSESIILTTGPSERRLQRKIKNIISCSAVEFFSPEFNKNVKIAKDTESILVDFIWVVVEKKRESIDVKLYTLLKLPEIEQFRRQLIVDFAKSQLTEYPTDFISGSGYKLGELFCMPLLDTDLE